jgi:hypothetical protein
MPPKTKPVAPLHPAEQVRVCREAGRATSGVLGALARSRLQLKNEGNELFAKKQWAGAAEKYRVAIAVAFPPPKKAHTSPSDFVSRVSRVACEQSS